MHMNRQSQTHTRFTPPPILPLHDSQCPGDQSVSLVGQYSRTTPVPALRRLSLSTHAYHHKVLAFQGWVLRLACTRRRDCSHAERAISKQSGKLEGEPCRP